MASGPFLPFPESNETALKAVLRILLHFWAFQSPTAPPVFFLFLYVLPSVDSPNEAGGQDRQNQIVSEGNEGSIPSKLWPRHDFPHN